MSRQLLVVSTEDQPLEAAKKFRPASESVLRVGAALYYAICSFGIVFVNKFVLTTLRFPSFLLFAFLQLIASSVALLFVAQCGIIKLPNFEFSVFKKIFPLPILFAVSLAAGLGGVQKLSLPMFTALRHTSILMTLLLEQFVLGIIPNRAVKFSVALIVGGSAIAAAYDLSFDIYGYAMIFVNNAAGALNGICLKKKLDANELGTYGLLFYNALFNIPLAAVAILAVDDLDSILAYFRDERTFWPLVAASMAVAFAFGLLLNHSMLCCTDANSPLTTTVVGALKNTAVTYVGMLTTGDYVFSPLNFTGITVSVFGSVLYAYATFVRTTGRVREVWRLPERRDPENGRSYG